MALHDSHSIQDDEIYVSEVMAFFNCNRKLAKTIICSSQMNGQLNGIKKICHDNSNREGKQ